MIKTARNLFVFLPFIFSCTNSPNDNLFKSLLELPHVELNLICENNSIFKTGKGYRWEMYQLSDETYDSFIEKFHGNDTISAPHRNSFSKTDAILSWRKTPSTIQDTAIINSRFSDYNHKEGVCFDQRWFFTLLKNKGNFYSAYYYRYTNSGVESYYWFIIESKTKRLYLQSEDL